MDESIILGLRKNKYAYKKYENGFLERHPKLRIPDIRIDLRKDNDTC
jgi:hypothetical protein